MICEERPRLPRRKRREKLGLGFVLGLSNFFSLVKRSRSLKDCGISIALFVDENSNAPSSSSEEEEEARVLCRDDTLFIIIIKSIILFGRSRRCQLRPSFAGVDFGQRDAHFVLLTPAGDSPRALVWTDFVV
jgi:hypothetical protein